MAKRHNLKNLCIKRVDLVDMGACYDAKSGDGAHVMLYKRAEPTEFPHLQAAEQAFNSFIEKYAGEPCCVSAREAVKPRTFAEVLNEREAQQKLDRAWDLFFAFSDAARSIISSDAAAKGTMLRESAEEFVAALASALPEITDEVTKMSTGTVEKVGRKISGERLQRLKAAQETINTIIAEGEEATMAGEKDTAAADAAVQKRIDDAIAKAIGDERARNEAEIAKRDAEIAKANERAAESEKVAKAERDARVIKDIEGEISKDFAGVPGMTAADAAVLKALRDGTVTNEQAQRIEALLKAAGTAAATALTTVGTGAARSAASNGTAKGDVLAKAAEMVAKGDAKNEAEAIDKMATSRDEATVALMKRYEAEVSPR